MSKLVVFHASRVRLTEEVKKKKIHKIKEKQPQHSKLYAKRKTKDKKKSQKYHNWCPNNRETLEIHNTFQNQCKKRKQEKYKLN